MRAPLDQNERQVFGGGYCEGKKKSEDYQKRFWGFPSVGETPLKKTPVCLKKRGNFYTLSFALKGFPVLGQKFGTRLMDLLKLWGRWALVGIASLNGGIKGCSRVSIEESFRVPRKGSCIELQKGLNVRSGRESWNAGENRE